MCCATGNGFVSSSLENRYVPLSRSQERRGDTIQQDMVDNIEGPS